MPYWLKMIGASDWPLADKWVEERPELLSRVRTPQTPRAIKRGDMLVYYSAVSQRLFAIGRSTMDGDNAQMELEAGEERWPYVLYVQVLLLIPRLALAPEWSVLGLPVTTVQQRSYAEISRSSYQTAWKAIVHRTGDS